MENFEFYCQSLMELMGRIPVVHTQQAFNYLNKKIGFKAYNKFIQFLYEMQRNCYVALAEDGYVIRYNYLPVLYGQNYPTLLNHSNKMIIKSFQSKYDSLDLKLKNQIDCLWLVADMADRIYTCLPTSQNSLFDLMFNTIPTEEKGSKIYEIIRIPEVIEDSMFAMLKKLEPVPDDEKDITNRIAILDNLRHKGKLPCVGFKLLVVLDKNERCGFTVYNRANDCDDIWQDEAA